MTPKISLIVAVVAAALAFAAPAAADNWRADLYQANQPGYVSPDAEDHALAAERSRTEAMLNARERSLQAGRVESPPVVSVRGPVFDDRFRIEPTTVSQPISVTSGSEVEWPQLGLGLAIGIVLMLGLFFTLRATRTRTAH